MNDSSQMTSAPGTSLIPDGVAAITTAHFAILAIFAALVVFGIIWGIRLRHARRQADRTVAADNADIVHRRDADHQPATPAAAPPRAPEAAQPSDPDPLADEPIAATAPFEASPATEAVPGSTPAPDDAAPDAAIPVTTLKGLGPKVAARLAELGITDARQLAALDDPAATALDAQLGTFAGRMARDRWIDQARLLAAGDTAGYKATFGNL